MDIRLKCPGCGKKFKTREEHGGKRAKCPECGKVLIVPTPAAQPQGTGRPGTSPRASTSQPSPPEPARRKAPSETPVEHRVPRRRSSLLIGNALVLAKWGVRSAVVIICVVIIVYLWGRIAEEGGIELFDGGNDRSVASDAGRENGKPHATTDESGPVAQLPTNASKQGDAHDSEKPVLTVTRRGGAYVARYSAQVDGKRSKDQHLMLLLLLAPSDGHVLDEQAAAVRGASETWYTSKDEQGKVRMMCIEAISDDTGRFLGYRFKLVDDQVNLTTANEITMGASPGPNSPDWKWLGAKFKVSAAVALYDTVEGNYVFNRFITPISVLVFGTKQ
ncbi:MAG: hypothetical protein ABIF82_03830 [Planctomycetota bacterium]